MSLPWCEVRAAAMLLGITESELVTRLEQLLNLGSVEIVQLPEGRGPLAGRWICKPTARGRSQLVLAEAVARA